MSGNEYRKTILTLEPSENPDMDEVGPKKPPAALAGEGNVPLSGEDESEFAADDERRRRRQQPRDQKPKKSLVKSARPTITKSAKIQIWDKQQQAEAAMMRDVKQFLDKQTESIISDLGRMIRSGTGLLTKHSGDSLSVTLFNPRSWNKKPSMKTSSLTIY